MRDEVEDFFVLIEGEQPPPGPAAPPVGEKPNENPPPDKSATSDFDLDTLRSIAGDEEPPGATKGAMIPKPRFDEVLEENKRLKAQLEQGAPPAGDQPPAQPTELERMETEREELQARADELLISGELEDRKVLLRQIREHDRQIARIEARDEVNRDKTETKVFNDLDSVITRTQKDYPFLDDKSDQANPTAITAVNSLMRTYIGENMSPAAALEMAVNDLAPVFKGTVKPDTTDPAKQEQIRKEREEEERRRASEVLNSQPPALPQRGDQSLKTSEKLSAKDVASMSEEQKRELFQ